MDKENTVLLLVEVSLSSMGKTLLGREAIGVEGQYRIGLETHYQALPFKVASAVYMVSDVFIQECLHYPHTILWAQMRRDQSSSLKYLNT